MLFGNMKSKNSRNADKLLLKNSAPKQTSVTNYVSGDKFKDAIIRAKSMSKRILGDVLDRLELVTDLDDYNAYIKRAAKNPTKEVAIDTETTSLVPYKGKVVGICLYTPGEKGIYVPINHISQLTRHRAKHQISPEDAAKGLKRLIRAKVKWIYHNAKFDMNFIYWNLGVTMPSPYWDTFIGAKLLNENESHNLKNLHTKYVAGDESKETASFNALFKGITFDLIPTDVAYMYAAYDPIQTYELYQFQKPFLTAEDEVCQEKDLTRLAWLFHNIEMPLIEVLFNMETYGVELDVELMQKLKEEFQAEMDEYEAVFKSHVEKYREEIENLRLTDYESYSKLDVNEKGEATISISSPKQLATLFYDIMKLTSNDPKKPRGTGEDIIKGFNHEIGEALLEYRSKAKLVSTYLDMDEHTDAKSNRVHTNYKQLGAATGRMSSEAPNLQNIPARGPGARIRTIFKATEGYYQIGSDMSQQEPRTLAEVSDDPKMIQAYIDGKDLYATIASGLYRVSYEDCLEFYPDGTTNKEGKIRRNNTKSVLLGQQLGSFPLNVAKRCA